MNRNAESAVDPVLQRTSGPSTEASPGHPTHTSADGPRQHGTTAAGSPYSDTAHDDDDDDEEGDGDTPEDEDDNDDSHTPNNNHSSNNNIQATASSSAPTGPGGATADDAKRMRACEACRGLKVRCQPDPNEPDGPCARCKKAKRNCVVTVPTRKRQKKTDSRVAELEKKIDLLTASLHARQAHSASHPPSTAGTNIAASSTAPQQQYSPPQKNMPPEITQPLRSGWGSTQVVLDEVREGAFQTPMPPSSMAAGQKRTWTERGNAAQDQAGLGGLRAPPSAARLDDNYEDVIDRGILPFEKATELFARYNNHMVPHLPMVVFPEGMPVEHLRETKPILFLSVMAAASVETASLQRQLVKELMQIFAEKIIMKGGKSLELIQALQLAIIWYYPPEQFEEIKFYQLIHMGAIMGIDLGLGRRTPGRQLTPLGVYNMPKNGGAMRNVPLDPTTIEARRTWLGCYYLASNSVIMLHRPELVRWTRFMSESLKILESSPDAAPTDKYFCRLVWTHQLAEEATAHLRLDDPEDVVHVNEQRTMHTLRKLDRDLQLFGTSMPRTLMQETLKISIHIVSLYIHDLALQGEVKTEAKPPRPPNFFREVMVSDASTVTTAQVNSIATCLTSIDVIFDTFLGMDIASIRCLPTFTFARISYALIILIKIHFSAADVESELSQVINKNDMRVDFYIDALLEKFRNIAAGDCCLAASKFTIVLVMLKGWFAKQTSSVAAGHKATAMHPPGATSMEGVCPYANTMQGQPKQPGRSSDSSTRDATPQAQAQGSGGAGGVGDARERRSNSDATPSSSSRNAGSSNTPLHLLSEIATNDRAQKPRGTKTWSLGARQPFMYDSGSGSGGGGGGEDSNAVNTPSASSGGGAVGPDPASAAGMDMAAAAASSSMPAASAASDGFFPGMGESGAHKPSNATGASTATTTSAGFTPDFSAFDMNHLTSNLTFSELANTFGLAGGDGWSGFTFQNNVLSGAAGGAGGDGTFPPMTGSGGFSAAPMEGIMTSSMEDDLRSAVAHDPWVGQWGDVINGMSGSNNPGGGPGGYYSAGGRSVWGGMPTFQM